MAASSRAHVLEEIDFKTFQNKYDCCLISERLDARAAFVLLSQTLVPILSRVPPPPSVPRRERGDVIGAKDVKHPLQGAELFPQGPESPLAFALWRKRRRSRCVNYITSHPDLLRWTH